SEIVQSEPARPPAPEGDGIFVLRLKDGDEPAQDLVERLRAARAASGADVVTCGVRLSSGESQLYIGDCGGLGVLTNGYGTVGLVRHELLQDAPDDDWLLYARL